MRWVGETLLVHQQVRLAEVLACPPAQSNAISSAWAGIAMRCRGGRRLPACHRCLRLRVPRKAEVEGVSFQFQRGVIGWARGVEVGVKTRASRALPAPTDWFYCLDICFAHGTLIPGRPIPSHCLAPQRVPHAQRTGLSPDLFWSCRQWPTW